MMVWGREQDSPPWNINLFLIFRAYLVKCCLRNRVVLYVESLFALGKHAEYPGQGRQWGRELVLQHVPVLLLEDASREGEPEELLDRLQVRVGACYSYHYRITISKPESRKIMSEGRSLGHFSKNIREVPGPWQTQNYASERRNSFSLKELVLIDWTPALREAPCWGPQTHDFSESTPDPVKPADVRESEAWGLGSLPTEQSLQGAGPGCAPVCIWLQSLCSNHPSMYKFFHFISTAKLRVNIP